MFGCEMDDPRIEEMDPIKKMWYFHNWVADQNDKVELAKNQAYLVGSFIAPQAVQKILGTEGTAKHKSTDAEFEKTIEMMEKEIKQREDKEKVKGKKKKHRRIKE